MKRLIVCGASGRMGSLICKLAEESRDWEVAGKADEDHPLEACVKNGGVIIDFTLPAGTEHHIALALQFKKPIVIGTTGLSADQHKLMEKAARAIPIVCSSNMSVGVNVLFKLIAVATEALGKNYSIEISETHHVHKKDSPSGTAKTMGTIVEKILGVAPPIQSFREGEVIGDHTIVFGSKSERLALMHRALHRSVFAEGALKAAKWILNQKPGLYTMADVLGLS